MIEVEGLHKRFGNVQALRDVTFTVPRGKIVGFLGANGAGKTTTMDIVCGCIGADQGNVRVCGYDVSDKPIQAWAKLGYLPDNPPLYDDMTVEDFIHYAAKLNRVKGGERKQRVEETLNKLSLTEVRHRIVGNLSKGYRQRVALGQALVHDPEVLVLDEPTEGLDPNQIVQIRELIRSIAGHHTIILSSHILSEVQNTCDHIVIIHQGEIVQQGSYEELLRQSQADATYCLRVHEDAPRLATSLEELAGISQSKLTEDGMIEVRFEKSPNPDEIDAIVRKALDGSHGIREISPKATSLEDVFFQLTQ